MSNDDMKLTLEKLRKDLEKTLIQTLIAPASVQTANTKKQLVMSMGQSRVERLKSSSTNYVSSFQTSAKGAWVKKAKATFESTTKKLNKITDN